MKDAEKKEIINLLKEKKLVIGIKTVLKGINKGKISKILVSSNIFQKNLKKLENVCKSLNIPITSLEIKGKELGTQCGKPFNITVLGVKKE